MLVLSSRLAASNASPMSAPMMPLVRALSNWFCFSRSLVSFAAAGVLAAGSVAAAGRLAAGVFVLLSLRRWWRTSAVWIFGAVTRLREDPLRWTVEELLSPDDCAPEGKSCASVDLGAAAWLVVGRVSQWWS